MHLTGACELGKKRNAALPVTRDKTTPERLDKAGGAYEVSEDPPGRQRMVDWPLQRLYRAGAFGAPDDRRAQLRHAAGEALYRHWYYGGLLRLGSRDYRQPYSGKGDAFAVMPATERQAYHRSKWRLADAALGGDRVASVTRAIVIDEKEPVIVGKVITGRQQEQQARAVAIEYLIDGLDRLRQHWDMRA